MFPVLYGKDKNGKQKEWRIRVENKEDYSIIVCLYGGLNDKKVENIRKIEQGKNKGKKNETTHYTQAILEAESKWKKKKEIECYVEDPLQLEESEDPLLPMLAHDYKKQKSKIVFPCYVQPKLDGYRAVFKNGSFYSRQGNIFDVMTDYFCTVNTEYTLDGELYSDELKFEELGVLRKKKNKLNEKDRCILAKIKYYIYDIVDPTLSFNERLCILNKLNKKYKNIIVVNTTSCISEDDVKQEYEKQVQLGFEGLMIRNGKGLYKVKNRSYDLQKYKEFMDDEFRIVGFEKEQGDLIVWVCETKEGKKFNVQSKGTREERNQLYINGGAFVGKFLWVQFFEYTTDGVPRFPKTMRSGEESIRDTVL